MIVIQPDLSVGGLVVLFFWILIGSLGLPGGTIEIIAESSLAASFYSLAIVILITFAAAAAGDILAYELARKLSGRIRKKLIAFSFFRNNEDRTKRLLNKYGFYIVFLTRFALVSLCQVMSYVSGLEKYSRRKYLMAVILGEFLFAVIYSLIGFMVGEIFGNLLSAINYAILAVVLILVVFYMIRSLVRKRRSV
jgi:membrane protein DedA with SNARE-associated domain